MLYPKALHEYTRPDSFLPSSTGGSLPPEDLVIPAEHRRRRENLPTRRLERDAVLRGEGEPWRLTRSGPTDTSRRCANNPGTLVKPNVATTDEGATRGVRALSIR